ncbi:MAG TPA: MFS transporter [Acetobacteraceae bacterium]|jgi:AAHS family 4-hydroxybenzoate transporter-like MFS transporter
MAEPSSSAIEHALENQRLGGLQLRVVAICGLIQMCDGFDVNSIGWSVPSLTHVWHLAPSAFALAFLWSNIGVMAGALLAGPIGDRFGRKPLLMISMTLFGIASLASAQAPSLQFLAMTRFFTGAGIAGGFAGTVALTGDYTPQRRRALLIMLTFTGAPLGGFVGGLVVSLLLHEGFGWQSIYILGGVFPLVLLVITTLWLPESPRFLAARTNLAPRHAALLQRLSIAPGQPHAVDLARGNPIRLLFGDGFAMQTTLLWIIFFCSLLDLFLFIFWLPEVLHLIGMTPAQAVFATSLYPLGGILAVLYLGWAIDRLGVRRSLAVHFAVGIVFISTIALVAMPYFALLGVVLMSGMTVLGSQTGLNAACGKLYPARMRVSGYGFATGIGRLGGIAAAPLGGFLLARGLPPTYVFLSACFFAAIAAAATAMLALPGRQTSAVTAAEAA